MLASWLDSDDEESEYGTTIVKQFSPEPLEPLEDPRNFRYTMFPLDIGKMDMWEMYKKSQSYFWTEDIANTLLAKDAAEWEAMAPNKQHFILQILKFFAASDGLVNETLELHLDRIQAREYKLWRNFQMAMEDIHSIAYSRLLETYIKDSGERTRLFRGIENDPTIKRKLDWVHRWMCHENDLHRLQDDTMEALMLLKESATRLYRAGLILENAHNPDSQADLDPRIKRLFQKIEEPKPSLDTVLVVNSIVEGVFFSGSFCAIFWLQEQGLLRGLGKFNELISRDEGTHTVFAILTHTNHIRHKLPEHIVHEMINEAVEIESDFIANALPKGLLGMNSELMTQYIKFVADHHLMELEYKPIYNTTNPFPFMEKQSISVRIADFFKSVPAEYRVSGANTTAEEQEIVDDENF